MRDVTVQPFTPTGAVVFDNAIDPDALNIAIILLVLVVAVGMIIILAAHHPEKRKKK